MEEKLEITIDGKSDTHGRVLGRLATIYCCQGDITDSDADSIVNAANNHLWMGSGVAGAIKRKGGQAIEDEAVRKGPIPVGEAIVTNAGNLKAKYVIHAAAMGQNLVTGEEHIKNATHNSLKRAEELKLQSIDFPALGTGVGGFSLDKCAELMINEVRQFLKQSASLKKVGFILFDKPGYQAFSSELKKLND